MHLVPPDVQATVRERAAKHVRILLQKSVPVETAAELIGDTEQMVRRHYSMPERQEHVRNVLQAAFAGRTRQKLVVVKKEKTPL